MVGAWAPLAESADRARYYASVSQHLAWYYEMLTERLPRVGMLAAAVTTNPMPWHSSMLNQARIERADDDRLDHLVRNTLGDLAGTVERFQTRCSPIADGALMHTLGVIAADIAQDWRRGCEQLGPVSHN